MNARKVIAAAGVVLGLAGCGTTNSAAPTPPSHTGSGPATVVLDERANHTTVKVATGATVRIDLHSTYWSTPTSSAARLVQQVGAPSVSAAPSCRPGGGCGTVTTTFSVRGTGTAQLTSARSSCGEAMNCPPDQRAYSVTIDVTG